MKRFFLLIVLCCAGCTSDAPSDAPPDAPPERGEEAVPGTGALEGSRQVHPLVDATQAQLFGAAAGSRWLSADSAAEHVSGGETYRLYTLTRFLGEREGTAPAPPGETCTNSTVRIPSLPERARDVLAVGGTWEALPRVPVAQDPGLPVYQEAVAALLRAQDIADPEVHITQILRVDLEGDGTDEVLVSGHLRRGSGTSAQAGDYGFVVLRKIVAGEVKTIPLEEEYYPEGCLAECAPATYRVSAVLDVNGDGVMEVVLATEYYEGEGKAIYRIEGDQVRSVLSWRCGA